MVDTPTRDMEGAPAAQRSAGGEQPVANIDRNSTLGRASSRPRKTLLLLAVMLAAGATLALGQPGGAQSSQASPGTNAARAHIIEKKQGLHVPTPTATTRPIFASKFTTTTTAPAPSTPALAPKTGATASGAAATSSVAPSAIQPPVAALVAEVEAAGIEPGSNWSWSMGDTSAQCGFNPGNSAGSGCTFGAAGEARSVFSGSPSLALVAHELANAETENDAVRSLMNEVGAAEAGTSWSPIDAVASCLVAHFMGFQDEAAGTWHCPAGLATVVAENIHDTIVTTTMTSTCGTKSGVVSTLTFTGTAGTLTVTAPTDGASPETVVAGTPVAVSGIGTFTAIDRGGTIDQTGECAS
jgi:hypothetical protein